MTTLDPFSIDITAPLKAAVRVVLAEMPQLEPYTLVCPVRPLTPEVNARFGEDGLGTAAATPLGIYINQVFFSELLPAQQAGLVLHEIAHVALMHLSDNWRDTTVPFPVFKRYANVAMDVVIELMIRDMSSAALRNAKPEPIKEYESYGCEGLNWRQVYEKIKLMAQSQDSGGQGKKGKGKPQQLLGLGDHHETGSTPESDPTKRAEQQKQLDEFRTQLQRAAALSEVIIEEAKAKAKSRGNTSDNATMSFAPQAERVSWRTQLEEFLTSVITPDVKSWRTIDRRALSKGTLRRGAGVDNMLPTLRLWVDTSGSVVGDFQAIASELGALFRSASSRVEYINYDADIKSVQVYHDFAGMPEAVEFRGMGGTSILTAITQLSGGEIAADEGIDLHDEDIPNIIFTDGEDDYFGLDAHLKGPILWVIFGGRGFTPPCKGTVIQVVNP